MRAFLLLSALLMAFPALAQEMDHSMHDMSAPPAASTATAEPDLAAEPDLSQQQAPTQLVPRTIVAPEGCMSDMDGMDMSGMDHNIHMQEMPAPSAHAHDMTPLSTQGLPVAAADRLGNTELAGEVKDGVREFHLTAAPIAWPITDKQTVVAWAYNGQVPGPMLRVSPGEKIRVILTNNLPEATTIHWHGVDVPNNMDGVPGISQDPVKPGESFTYEFTVPNTPGTFWYHTHVNPDKQQALGLYGAFIIDGGTDKSQWDSEHTLMLGEWTVRDGGNIPAMPMEGMFPNYFTINGKAWDATEHITAKVGERVLLRLVGAGSFSHPIHMHGAPFTIIAVDGHTLPPAQRMVRDTITVNPGERYDIVWTPTRPGTWLLHCHISHHTMNDGAEVNGMGGMALPIEVTQ